MTVEYPGTVSSNDDERDPGDSRVKPLAISKVVDEWTRLHASVAATTREEARDIGLAGITRWAEQIGLPTGNPVVITLFARDND
jgi:hypothetical protein